MVRWGLHRLAGWSLMVWLLGGCYDPSVTCDDCGIVACPRATDVDVGGATACAVQEGDGRVACWGRNGNGQQGIGFSFAFSPDARFVLSDLDHEPLTGILQVEQGIAFGCVLAANGDVSCWGTNTAGQVQASTTQELLYPTRVAGLGPATQIALGGEFACALLLDGTVWCWGRDNEGMLGDGAASSTGLAPVPVAQLADVAEIAAGTFHACARRTSGTVACWGGGENGQSGPTAAGADSPTPVDVPLEGVPSALAGGDLHSCAVVSGAVWCWGAGQSGQLGNGLSATSHTPVQVVDDRGQPIAGARSLALGDEHSCVLLEDGRVACFGSGTDGQLGLADGAVHPRATFIPLPQTIGAVQELAAFWHTTCARGANGVACFGRNEGGQLGAYPGLVLRRSTPTAVATCPRPTCAGVDCPDGCVAELRASAHHACAFLSDGTAWCWGDGDVGALGNGTGATDSAVPLPVLMGEAPLPVSDAGLLFRSACFVTASGILCSGDNSSQQYGDAALPSTSFPEAGPGLGPVLAVGRGDSDHVCAVKPDASLYCWGCNADGQAGASITSLTSPPTLVLADVADVTLGESHSCARSLDGSVRCWGLADEGRLGSALTGPQPMTQAVLVAGAPMHARRIASGLDHTCVITDEAATLCWGVNAMGQLGNGGTSSSDTPVPVMLEAGGPLENAEDVSGGRGQTCAVRQGTLYCWGSNAFGQLGLEGVSQSLYAVEVPLPFAVDEVEAGTEFTCVRAAGKRGVYCAGDNMESQLARDERLPQRGRFEPVPLPCP